MSLDHLSNDQIRARIGEARRRMQRLELRAALVDIPQWEQFREHVLDDLGEIERKLLTERNDEYAMGRLQGAYDKLQLFAFTREECVRQLQAYHQDIQVAEATLANREKHNFRSPPPGRDPRQPPGGQR